MGLLKDQVMKGIVASSLLSLSLFLGSLTLWEVIHRKWLLENSQEALWRDPYGKNLRLPTNSKYEPKILSQQFHE